MPALENHTGLLAQTIPFFNRRNIVNVSNQKAYYCFWPAMQRNMKRAIDSKWTKFQFGLSKEVFEGGGTSFKFNVQVTSRNNFAWVTEDDPVNIDKRDFQVQGTLPWRLARVQDWSYGDWELSACKGKEELTNLIKGRALGNEQGAADGFEAFGWGPPPASTDDKTAFPLRYYLFTEPESTTGSYTSFTGINDTTLNGNLLNVNHASFTSGPFGQSRATYRRLGNWNAQYTTLNDTDGLEKYTHACLDTEFFSPAPYESLTPATVERACYTTKGNLIIKARLKRQQNDQNGSDLIARFTDNEDFRIPWFRVPFFESGEFTLYGTTGSHKDVIYGIDWNSFEWATKSGFNMTDKIFPPDRSAPHTYTHARFLGGQLVCFDPSRNFVLSK